MSQSQTQTQPTATVPAQQPEKEQPKRFTGYRVEDERRIQINRSHINRRERAEVLKQLSIGLFGRRRYRNQYLVSSLNNFYHSLMIANTLQKRVQKLALIISMDKVKFTEFAEEGAQGVEKQFSTFIIKITREPTEEDKQHPGFNGGLQTIENPLTEIIKSNRGPRRGDDRRRGGNRKFQPRREGDRREGERKEFDRRDGRSDRRRDDQQNQGERRPQRKYYEKETVPGRRRPERDTRDKQTQDKKVQRVDRGGERNQPRDYNREDRRQAPRRNQRDEEDFDRRPTRYTENKQERPQNDSYIRGERKTRGTQPSTQGGRVAEHQYRKEHLNRQNVREERKERAPNRQRYDSDEEY